MTSRLGTGISKSFFYGVKACITCSFQAQKHPQTNRDFHLHGIKKRRSPMCISGASIVQYVTADFATAASQKNVLHNVQVFHYWFKS